MNLSVNSFMQGFHTHLTLMRADDAKFFLRGSESLTCVGCVGLKGRTEFHMHHVTPFNTCDVVIAHPGKVTLISGLLTSTSTSGFEHKESAVLN